MNNIVCQNKTLNCQLVGYRGLTSILSVYGSSKQIVEIIIVCKFCVIYVNIYESSKQVMKLLSFAISVLFM